MIKSSVGMFISQEGEMSFVRGSHINEIKQNPVQFGLTIEELNKRYEEYGEPIGLEGRARHDLICKALEHGWIRLRRYPNRYWSVTVDQYSESKEKLLKQWAQQIVSGELGQREEDVYMPVVVRCLKSNDKVIILLLDLLK